MLPGFGWLLSTQCQSKSSLHVFGLSRVCSSVHAFPSGAGSAPFPSFIFHSLLSSRPIASRPIASRPFPSRPTASCPFPSRPIASHRNLVCRHDDHADDDDHGYLFDISALPSLPLDYGRKIFDRTCKTSSILCHFLTKNPHDNFENPLFIKAPFPWPIL